MAKADAPGAEELREIGRRLCALIDITLPEPIDADRLREVVDDRSRDKSIRFALKDCADALAEHELPAPIRRLLMALREYCQWSLEGEPRRKQLVEAFFEAGPLLEEEAEARAQGEAEANAQALTAEQRADGCRVKLWPSHEALSSVPREVFVSLQKLPVALARLLKILEDLPRLDASPEVLWKPAPIKTSIAKTLADDGYGVLEITDVEPYANTSIERRKAQNTVRRRLESTSENMLFTRKVDPSLPNAATKAAAREEAARFVAGVGRNVVILAPERPRRVEEHEE